MQYAFASACVLETLAWPIRKLTGAPEKLGIPQHNNSNTCPNITITLPNQTSLTKNNNNLLCIPLYLTVNHYSVLLSCFAPKYLLLISKLPKQMYFIKPLPRLSRPPQGTGI